LRKEDMSIAEESEDDDFSGYPAWQAAMIKEAVDVVVNWEDYIELPDVNEINEYGIMEDFCFSIKNDRIRDKMCNSIKGRGAFRRFRDHISFYDLEQEWYDFRDNALRDIAISWCEENGILYVV